MSRDWTKEELNTASEMMKQNGHMGFEEFCHAIEKKQPVSFDLRERDRKELVKDISEILGEKAEYMRMPTCAYRIGNYTIAKDGTLTWGAEVTDAEVLLQTLTDKGCKDKGTVLCPEGQGDGSCVQILTSYLNYQAPGKAR